MPDHNDKHHDEISAVLQTQLTALEVLAFISRHMNPPDLPDIISTLGMADMPVRDSLEALQKQQFPEQVQPVLERINNAGSAISEAFVELRKSRGRPNSLMEAYYALRHGIRAREVLYPLTSQFPMVSRHFLEEGAREDEVLLARLKEGAGRPGTGIQLSAGARSDGRGGFSIYVPESYDPAIAHPVILALHGAGGTGRAFLWNWLRAARTRGAILVSPTSQSQTWALDGPDVDTPNLASLMDQVRERWNVDEKHLMMTGMSDGGSFTYMSGLQPEQPYTHLAPVAASFPPLMLEFYSADRMKDLPVHITHGALDWLFPPAQGRGMAAALESFNARVIYREIDDLSHTNPDDEENAEVMDWFLGEG
ncbi:MAG: phospholipase [Alphaproteobacteria bacterium]